MNEFLERILGLKSLHLDDAAVRLEWARELPAWGWGFAIGGAIVLAIWSYWRLDGSAMGRRALSMVRIATLLLLLVLLAGPQLVKRSERTELDWVVVLMDRSASMRVADVERASGRISRDQQLREAMAAAAPALAKIGEQRRVVWLGFDRGAFDVPDPAKLPEAGGLGTNLGAALEQGMRRVVARPRAEQKVSESLEE